MAFFIHLEHTDTHSEVQIDWGNENSVANAVECVPTPETPMPPPQTFYSSPAGILLEVCTLVIAVGNIMGFIQSKRKN